VRRWRGAREVDIGLIGVPNDSASRTGGSADGPREIRNASVLRRDVPIRSRLNPYDLCRSPISAMFGFRPLRTCRRKLRNRGVLPKCMRPVTARHRVRGSLDHISDLQSIAALRHLSEWWHIGGIRYVGRVEGSKFHQEHPFGLAVEGGADSIRGGLQIGIRGGQNFMDGIEFRAMAGGWYIEEFASLGVAGVTRGCRSSRWADVHLVRCGGIGSRLCTGRGRRDRWPSQRGRAASAWVARIEIIVAAT